MASFIKSESKDITQIRGYLKLSISVLHDSDPRIELKSDPDSTNCFIPSQVKVEYRQLKIYLMQIEEVPDMDSTVKMEKKIDHVTHLLNLIISD